MPGDQTAPPAFAAAGPPREALAGFWRRLVAAFLDWILVGIVAAAIGDLFGVEGPTPPAADSDGFNFQLAGTGPFILVELAYFTYFHATTAGQSIGNKILGIRVLDADTGRSLPYARAFVRALVSNLSALPCFLGYFWMLGNRASGPGTTSSPTAWSSGPPSTARRVRPPCPVSGPDEPAFRPESAAGNDPVVLPWPGRSFSCHSSCRNSAGQEHTGWTTLLT